MLKWFRRLFLLGVALGVTTDASAVADKWETRSTNAAPDFVKGVQSTDKDPTALAIAAIPRMKTNIVAAIDSGKVANGLRRAGKQGWIDGVVAKGESAYSNGVSAAKDKVAAAFAPLLTFENGLQQKIAAMPNVTDADREKRMIEWVRGMRGYKKP